MKKSKASLVALSLEKDAIRCLRPQQLRQLQGGREDSPATTRCSFTTNQARRLFCEAARIPFSIRFAGAAEDGTK